MLRMIALLLFFPAWALAQTSTAPDPEELAAVRGELTQLYAEISALRAAMAVQGAGAAQPQLGGPLTVRLDTLEGELRSLTGRMEQIEFRIGKIVEDGTRRIGDLEFRLVELEGGDISALGDTPTLGGAAVEVVAAEPPAAVPEAPKEEAVELAFAEESDFERATLALGDGDHARAVEEFTRFLSNYPGGPLSARALFHKGEAHEALGEHKAAARSYLDSFSAEPSGAYAPQALMKVGLALSVLGKMENACQTLGEVLIRYPESDVTELTRSNQQRLGCS